MEPEYRLTKRGENVATALTFFSAMALGIFGAYLFVTWWGI